ncbi:TIGR04283 family arsenosugar biosynthesis glycosyltransferase [Rhodovibrionaceae bacterium A322]
MTAPTLSIVIPTLNAASCWPSCLPLLQQAERHWGAELEILIVDGGSEDRTPLLVREAGYLLLNSAPGRGRQLALGGRVARGDWLLFLHADSLLPDGWCDQLTSWMSQRPDTAPAAYFTLAFNSRSGAARRLEALVRWRNDQLALPYGDQGLLLPVELYRASGGYPEIDLMEDVALIRRLHRTRNGGGEKRRAQRLPMVITTSAERYHRDGWISRPLRNLLLLGLYYLGCSPDRLARFYGKKSTGKAA